MIPEARFLQSKKHCHTLRAQNRAPNLTMRHQNMVKMICFLETLKITQSCVFTTKSDVHRLTYHEARFLFLGSRHRTT